MQSGSPSLLAATLDAFPATCFLPWMICWSGTLLQPMSAPMTSIACLHCYFLDWIPLDRTSSQPTARFVPAVHPCHRSNPGPLSSLRLSYPEMHHATLAGFRNKVKFINKVQLLRAWTLELEIKSKLCHLLHGWLQRVIYPFVCLSFIICKMGEIIISISQGWCGS